MNRIFLASDHGGYELKTIIIQYLRGLDYKIEDLGTDSDASVDYPDFGNKLCMKVREDKNNLGILLCGTGIGMSIAANKHNGIRAALCHDNFTAKMSRLHNNANVLCMGGRTTGVEVAKDIVRTWLDSKFEGGRHIKRLNKINIIK